MTEERREYPPRVLPGSHYNSRVTNIKVLMVVRGECMGSMHGVSSRILVNLDFEGPSELMSRS